jgi:hypothetical protein
MFQLDQLRREVRCNPGSRVESASCGALTMLAGKTSARPGGSRPKTRAGRPDPLLANRRRLWDRFVDQIRTAPGDVFVVEAAGFGPPRRHALFIAANPSTAVEARHAAAPGEPEPLRKAAS